MSTSLTVLVIVALGDWVKLSVVGEARLASIVAVFPSMPVKVPVAVTSLLIAVESKVDCSIV